MPGPLAGMTGNDRHTTAVAGTGQQSVTLAGIPRPGHPMLTGHPSTIAGPGPQDAGTGTPGPGQSINAGIIAGMMTTLAQTAATPVGRRATTIVMEIAVPTPMVTAHRTDTIGIQAPGLSPGPS